MKIAIVNPIMTTVTAGGLLAASRISGITSPQTDDDNLIVELAKSIAALGHEVTVFASDFYQPLHSVGEALPGVRVVYLPTKLCQAFPPAYIPFTPHLYSHIRRGEYSVIQCE